MTVWREKIITSTISLNEECLTGRKNHFNDTSERGLFSGKKEPLSWRLDCFVVLLWWCSSFVNCEKFELWRPALVYDCLAGISEEKKQFCDIFEWWLSSVSCSVVMMPEEDVIRVCQPWITRSTVSSIGSWLCSGKKETLSWQLWTIFSWRCHENFFLVLSWCRKWMLFAFRQPWIIQSMVSTIGSWLFNRSKETL